MMLAGNNKLDFYRRYLDKLSSRDKSAIYFLVVFLVGCAVYWLLVYSFTYRARAIESFENTRGIVWWVDSMSDKILAANGDALVVRNKSLLELASADGQDLGIVFKRVQPEGDDILQAWVENVRFNASLVWLHRLNSMHKISIQQLSIEPTSEEGYVNIRITLERRL